MSDRLDPVIAAEQAKQLPSRGHAKHAAEKLVDSLTYCTEMGYFSAARHIKKALVELLDDCYRKWSK